MLAALFLKSIERGREAVCLFFAFFLFASGVSAVELKDVASYLQDLNYLREEYERFLIEKSSLNIEKKAKEGIAIYSEMERILKTKREFYNLKRNSLRNLYNAAVAEENSEMADEIEKKIFDLDGHINEISREIRKIKSLRERLENFMTSYYNNLKEKRNEKELAVIVDKLKLLYADKAEFEKYGASPDEIAEVLGEIKYLEELYTVQMEKAGVEYDKIKIDLENLKNGTCFGKKGKSYEKFSFPDKYKYRFDVRNAADAVKYRRINDKDANGNVYRLMEDKTIRVDKRFDAVKKMHNKPTKVIEIKEIDKKRESR